jgi:PAS domain S-box-containing protein
MQKHIRQHGRGYLVAILSMLVCATLRAGLSRLLDGQVPLLPLIASVAITAWYGGWYPGLFATTLNLIAGTLLFVRDDSGHIPFDSVMLVRSLFFFGTGVFISRLYESLHESRRKLMVIAGTQRAGKDDAEIWKARYEAAVKASRCILYDSNRQTGDVIYGGECETILGYSAAELNGNIQTWVNLIHPDDRPIFLTEVTRTNINHSPYAADYRMLRKDGQTVWMRDDGHFAESIGERPVRIIGFVKNVTEQRQAEMERTRLAERLTLLTDHTPLAVIEWNADFVITRWAGQAEHVFGWTAAEVIGKRFNDFPFVHPDDHAEVENSAKVIRSSSSSFNIRRNRNLTKSGNCVACEWYNSVLYNESGQMMAVLSLVLDVTERRHAEESLRKSEERFRQLADAMPQVVWIADAAGRVQYYNSRVQDFSGVSRNPDGTFEWQPLLHPDDLKETTIAWQGAVQSGTSYQSEHRVFMKDGTYRWHLSRGLPTKSERSGEIQWFGTATDIHDLKVSQNALAESEATLRGVYENSPLMMGVVEVEGDDLLHIYDNPATCRFFNVPFGTTSGRWAHDMGVPKATIHSWVSAYQQCEQSRTPVSFEYSHQVKNGCRQLSATVAWLGAASGSRNRFCYIAEDITDRRRNEEELREAARRKDEFLATLAHELRNPLAPIRTGLEVLRLAKGDASIIEQVRLTMERQTQQLITLVDDLLDVSRITRGRLELRKCRVNLAEIVTSAVEASKPPIDEGRHELKISAPDEPIFLDADPNRLAQVISNLLNNAAKYTPECGRIELSIQKQASEVLIAVQDNGVGIAVDMQHRIFEMFAQIDDRPLERGFRGLGIGLTLVKSLVEMHGGRVDVHSDGPDKGSRFTITLPIPAEPTPKADTAVESALSPIPGKKILVVDDNREAALTLSILVKMLGHEVQTANDGLQAVQVAEEFRPELMLMDIGMPKMNGYEAARFIREQPWGENIILVALTGWGQEGDKQKSKQAGFDDHLVKPADPQNLQRVLAIPVRPH